MSGVNDIFECWPSIYFIKDTITTTDIEVVDYDWFNTSYLFKFEIFGRYTSVTKDMLTN